MKINKKNSLFEIQDSQYEFPYHHIVMLEPFSQNIVMPWGLEYRAYLQRVIDRISVIKPRTLLDVGCGEGKMILELAKRNTGIIMKGVDLSERAILFAKAFNFNNNASFECANLSKIEGRYDVITLVETIEHIPDSDISTMVHEIDNHLTDCGKVIITVPSIVFPVLRKHYRHYSIETIISQFKGFEIEQVEYLVTNSWLYRLLIKISRKFSNFSLLSRITRSIFDRFVTEAGVNSGRHILCVLKKKHEKYKLL